ncbi:MAG: right-handed parallel beta-helix repeat-containing protein, partial [Candidatus Rokuibacteriota bacterium]
MRQATVVVGFLLLAAGAAAAPASARVIEIFPPSDTTSCNEEFETVANTLQPGDELVLHDGVYSQTCARTISRNGTAASPIVIRAAAGARPIITRPMNASFDFNQNNLEISSSSYLVIRGLTFRGGDIGIAFRGTNHHVTLEDNEVFETGNNAIALNGGDSDALVFRRNHVHHTGLYALGSTEGEGMYVGCNNATCLVTNSLIENNYIHHTRSTSGGGNDGIEIKPGSANNIVRNNVIHDTTIGTRYPCIFVYGDGVGANIVEGNVMWNCGEAIQVVSDAVIRNNIILTSDVGITAAPHAQVNGVRNVTIV